MMTEPPIALLWSILRLLVRNLWLVPSRYPNNKQLKIITLADNCRLPRRVGFGDKIFGLQGFTHRNLPSLLQAKIMQIEGTFC
jgi:hypothetical protein